MRKTWRKLPARARWAALVGPVVIAALVAIPQGTSTYQWSDSAVDSTGKRWRFDSSTDIVKGHWLPLWEWDEVQWSPSPPSLPGPLQFTSPPSWSKGVYAATRWKIIETEAAAGRMYTSGGGLNWLGLATQSAAAAAAWLVMFLLCVFVMPARFKRTDLCPNCQYPREGLKPGAVCPECGQSP